MMNRLLLIVVSLIISFGSCQNATESEQEAIIVVQYEKMQGKTMGVYYQITFDNPQNLQLQPAVDSLLMVINDQVSTYIPTANIAQFNDATTQTIILKTTEHEHFIYNYNLSKEIVEATDGFFDPTVMPLVNYWGFGYTEKRAVTKVDTAKVKALLEKVGFDKINNSYDTEILTLTKTAKGIQLDFSAIAKGYAVDLIGELLTSRGIQHYYIDIGGECVVKGKSPRNNLWRIGINTPRTDAGLIDFQQIIALSDKAIATSGNYRNYFEVDGKKYAHSIHPKTGFPEMTNLLSATVVTSNCATADAYATALMIMGTDKAFEFASSHEGLEVYLIYSDEKGTFQVKYTEGFKTYLKN